MELALKAKKRNFIFAVVLTVALAAGIPCIVMGAIGLKPPSHDNAGYIVLLTFGIICVVAGFYGSPIAWSRLAILNQELTLVKAVTEEHLHTVADLAQRLSVNGKTASATLNNCIRKGYLVGFIREGDALVLNENRAPEKRTYAAECPFCNAKFSYTAEDARCPYCGSPVQK